MANFELFLTGHVCVVEGVVVVVVVVVIALSSSRNYAGCEF